MISLRRWHIFVLSLVSVAFGWWYVALPLLIYGMLRYRFYAEIIFFGIMYDALFGMVPGSGWGGYLGTIFGISAFIVYMMIKGAIRR